MPSKRGQRRSVKCDHWLHNVGGSLSWFRNSLQLPRIVMPRRSHAFGDDGIKLSSQRHAVNERRCAPHGFCAHKNRLFQTRSVKSTFPPHHMKWHPSEWWSPSDGFIQMTLAVNEIDQAVAGLMVGDARQFVELSRRFGWSVGGSR